MKKHLLALTAAAFALCIAFLSCSGGGKPDPIPPPPPVVSVTGVTLNKASTDLLVGATETL